MKKSINIKEELKFGRDVAIVSFTGFSIALIIIFTMFKVIGWNDMSFIEFIIFGLPLSFVAGAGLGIAFPILKILIDRLD